MSQPADSRALSAADQPSYLAHDILMVMIENPAPKTALEDAQAGLSHSSGTTLELSGERFSRADLERLK